MRTLICPQCQKPFETSHNSQKYCCKECSEQAHRDINREKMREKTIHKPKPCPTCGKEFVGSQHTRLYCSKECAQAAKNRRNKTCEGCGKSFQGSPMKRFCSKDCSGTHRQSISKFPPITKKCERCGIEFTVPYRKRLYRFCSRACGSENANIIKFRTVDKECPVCGKIFMLQYYRRNDIKYCSKKCSIEGCKLSQKEFKESRKNIDYVNNRSRKNRTTVNGKRAYEYRHIMAEIVGRELESTECVHHIDCDEQNNDPSNLYLCENDSEHMVGHHSLARLVKYLLSAEILKFKDGKYYFGDMFDDEHVTGDPFEVFHEDDLEEDIAENPPE